MTVLIAGTDIEKCALTPFKSLLLFKSKGPILLFYLFQFQEWQWLKHCSAMGACLHVLYVSDQNVQKVCFTQGGSVCGKNMFWSDRVKIDSFKIKIIIVSSYPISRVDASPQVQLVNWQHNVSEAKYHSSSSNSNIFENASWSKNILSI